MPESLEEVLSKALEMEVHIRDFYLESMAKVESDLAAEILQFLADQEVIHMENIQAYQKQLTGESPALDIELLLQQGTKQRAHEFFSARRQYFQDNVTAYASDADIYKMGLEIEKEGFEYYQQKATETDDEQARKLFTYLQEEETTHYKLLDELSTYFTKPGLWFLEEEGWLFEG